MGVRHDPAHRAQQPEPQVSLPLSASKTGAPLGLVGTRPSSRGDNPAFVSFVQRPEQDWAFLPHKSICWWGLVPLSLLSGQGWGWR